NIDGCIVVSVQRQATRTSDPSGRQVEILKHCTTLRTTFGAIGRVNRYHLTSGACSLVHEELAEDTPAAVQNAFAQVLIPNHVFDAQGFKRDPVVLLYQLGA